MPKWFPVAVETGLHRPHLLARNGEVCAADAIGDVVRRTNSALGRRQRLLAGCSSPYTCPDASAAARYYGCFRTSTSVTKMVARWVIAPRNPVASTYPVATLQLKTKHDDDAGWTSQATVYQALTGSTYTPEQIQVVEQTLTGLEDGGLIAGQDITYKVELARGFRLLSFSLAEQPRTTLSTDEGVGSVYAAPGQAIRTMPGSAIWTALGTLWEQHAGIGAWWLCPNSTATCTGANYLNVIDLTTTTQDWTAPGVRMSLPSITRLGMTTAHITVWAVLEGNGGTGTVDWELVQTTAAGADVTIASGVTAGTGMRRVRTKAVDYTPHSDVRNYQFLIRPTVSQDTAKCWGFGWYLEG